MLSQVDRGRAWSCPKDALERTGYRLPTEAEWEYACRSGTTTLWPHGLSEPRLTDYAWSLRNSGRVMHPPGLKRPNEMGLFDVLGNASEWCTDLGGWTPTTSGPGKTCSSSPRSTEARGRFPGRVIPGSIGRYPLRQSEPPPAERAAAVFRNAPRAHLPEAMRRRRVRCCLREPDGADARPRDPPRGRRPRGRTPGSPCRLPDAHPFPARARRLFQRVLHPEHEVVERAAVDAVIEPPVGGHDPSPIAAARPGRGCRRPDADIGRRAGRRPPGDSVGWMVMGTVRRSRKASRPSASVSVRSTATLRCRTLAASVKKYDGTCSSKRGSSRRSASSEWASGTNHFTPTPASGIRIRRAAVGLILRCLLADPRGAVTHRMRSCARISPLSLWGRPSSRFRIASAAARASAIRPVSRPARGFPQFGLQRAIVARRAGLEPLVHVVIQVTHE